jgi:hypothetical protein
MASELLAPGAGEGRGLLSRARRLAGRARRRLQAMIAPPAWEWSIGLYGGPSPLALQPLARKPVLARRHVRDVRADIVADPFMIRSAGRWWMFFEIWGKQTDRGVIGLASSEDARSWHYERVVLDEPFHLSYPHVFEWDGEYYMTPESFEAGAVRLYRADDFPWRWSHRATLLDGEVLLDPTVFRHAGRWWMFVETNPQHRFDTLRLFYSDRLDGGWREHPCSPVIADDPHHARPAGSVLLWEGRLIRLTQDCAPEYGLRVHAFAVEELSTTAYRERHLGIVLDKGRLGWNAAGMHHLDAKPDGAGGWIACVDGRR